MVNPLRRKLTTALLLAPLSVSAPAKVAAQTAGAETSSTETSSTETPSAETSATESLPAENQPEETKPTGPPATLANPWPKIARAYLVERNGQPLWGQAPDCALPPASLTKLMTALLVRRQLPLEKTVRISARAAASEGTRLKLRAGDVCSVADLLQASLLLSANDACVALAEEVDGSENHFAERMNREAQALGLHATRFSNACGFDRGVHHSSVRDLLHLARVLLRDDWLAGVVAMREARIRVNDRPRTVRNSNALIGILPGAAGVKTGYTQKAGKCVIALARREQDEVLAVLLNAPDRWWSIAGLLEKAFAAPKA